MWLAPRELEGESDGDEVKEAGRGQWGISEPQSGAWVFFILSATGNRKLGGWLSRVHFRKSLFMIREGAGVEKGRPFSSGER